MPAALLQGAIKPKKTLLVTVEWPSSRLDAEGIPDEGDDNYREK
jgi:hypothetical protein